MERVDFKELRAKHVEASSVLIAIGPRIVRRFPMTMRCASGAYRVPVDNYGRPGFTWTGRLGDYNKAYHRARKGLVQHRLSLLKRKAESGS